MLAHQGPRVCEGPRDQRDLQDQRESLAQLVSQG